MISSAELDRNIREISEDLRGIDVAVVLYLNKYEGEVELENQPDISNDLYYKLDEGSDEFQIEGDILESPLEDLFESYDRIRFGGERRKAEKLVEDLREDGKDVFLDEELCY